MDKELYLCCYDRLFAIKARAKNSYSYDLSAEQVERLKTLFDNLDRPEKFDLAPANSRVVIEIGGEQFNISNYNT